MKNKEQFDWAIKVLVKAYFNDELKKGICGKCAVGSLVADACKYEGIWDVHWVFVHMVNEISREQEFNHPLQQNVVRRMKGLEQIESTGYTWQETAKIELAFENGGEDMFDGLMSVVDCLIEIHEGNEQDKVEAKEMFVR
jgi:hypothetical protein